MVHSDDMLLNYFVQGLVATTRNSVTEALHSMTMKEPYSLFNVFRLAQAREQTYRARIAVFEKSSNV